MGRSKSRIKFWGNITRRTIVMDSKGNIKPAVLNQLKWHTQLPITDIQMAIEDVYMNKSSSKAKGVGTVVRAGDVLNTLYSGQLDNFFFNMLGVSIDGFVKEVNTKLADDLKLPHRIDRAYVENPLNWTGEVKNSYKRYNGDLKLPGGLFVHFNWDYDMGTSWSII